MCACVWGGGVCRDVHSPEAAVTQQLSQTGTLKLTGCLPSARSHASYSCNRSRVDVISNVSEFTVEETKKIKQNSGDKERGGTCPQPIAGEKGKKGGWNSLLVCIKLKLC